MNYHNSTNFGCIYEEGSYLERCMDDIKNIYKYRELDTRYIIKYNYADPAGDNQFKVFDEFTGDNNLIVASLLNPSSLKELNNYINTNNLNIFEILFSTISKKDITTTNFPIPRNKEKYEISSEVINVDLSKDTEFIAKLQTLNPSGSYTKADFSENEILLYLITNSILTVRQEYGIDDPSAITQILYSKVQVFVDTKIALSKENNFKFVIGGYEIGVDDSNTNNVIADEPSITVPFSNDVRYKTAYHEPFLNICNLEFHSTYYTSNQQYIIVVSTISGNLGKMVRGFVESIDAALDDINENEPIFEKNTYSIPLDCTNGMDDVMISIDKYIEKLDVIAVVLMSTITLVEDFFKSIYNIFRMES